jgi:hypothetical protein
MVGRLLSGALIGGLLGALLAAALIKGLGIVAFGAVLAYASAAVAGALAGLFAGKPIWARGALIEGGLKAFFGALLAAGAMFALRQWVHTTVDLSSFGAGAGELGQLPATALPLVAGVLGALFGIDNTPDPSAKRASGPSERVRVSRGNGKAASEAQEEEDQREQDELGASRRARR